MGPQLRSISWSSSLGLCVALLYVIALLSSCNFGASALPTAIGAQPEKSGGNNQLPRGPPIAFSDPLVTGTPASVPQPPSIEGIDLIIKAPAIPDQFPSPGPPAIPHPSVVALFEKEPDTFEAQYNQWVRDNCPHGPNEDVAKNVTSVAFVCPQTDSKAVDPHSERIRREVSTSNRVSEASPSPMMTYNQFITAAVVTGLPIGQSVYTMFAPSDAFLKRNNISLPILALRNMNCARQIVRTHVIRGRRPLNARTEEIALSLLESPIFINAKEANGIAVVRGNVETDYGVVHIIDGLIDEQRLVLACPQLNLRSPADAPAQHSINLRKVPSNDQFLDHVDRDEGQTFSQQFQDNQIAIGLQEPQQLSDVPDDLSLPDESTSPEADVPLELLANIDNFAHAMKLTWQTDADDDNNVVAVLQNLGASTFLALLERSDLMSTLANEGPWTIFAPDNDAWQVLPKDTFDYIMKDRTLLTEILSYHIVPMNVTRRQFTNNMMLPSVHFNLPVHVNFYTDGWASWYTVSGSQILNLDEMASNGVVHVVRSVLFPPLGDLNSTVHATPALRAATALLESSSDSSLFDDSESLTAFLPMDSPLLNNTLSTLDPAKLSGLLQHQVVRGTWFVSGLIDGDLLFTINGEPLSVSHNGDCIGINGACIVVRDITLSNGVLHVVDKLF